MLFPGSNITCFTFVTYLLILPRSSELYIRHQFAGHQRMIFVLKSTRPMFICNCYCYSRKLPEIYRRVYLLSQVRKSQNKKYHK
jgi:hypothetical protein